MIYSRSRRGNTMVLTIVVSIVMTGLVTAMAWVAGESAQRTANFAKSDEAFFAAEAGIQRLTWYSRNNQMASVSSPLTGTVNGYAYSTSWTTINTDTLKVTSTGSLGNVQYKMYSYIIPYYAPLPTFASVGDFDNKNVTIVGDVMTAGNYSNAGNGSLDGNLMYTGTATDTTGITGGVAKFSGFLTIDFLDLDVTLKSSAITKGTTDVIDFTAMAGTNKVIYVNGNVTNPTILGSGTLYVNGNITLTNPNTLVGSAAAPVNLVATGTIDFQKKVTLNGSLYTKGNWNRAQVDLIGTVYVAGISPSNTGMSSFTSGPTPWFDPRIAGGPSARTTTILANVTGPLP